MYAFIVRVDRPGESVALGVDEGAVSLGLKNYVSMQVEKFDSQGQYLDSEVTFSVCLENQLGEKDAAVAVFRKGLQDKVFSEVSSIFQSPIAGCFQVRMTSCGDCVDHSSLKKSMGNILIGILKLVRL